jgi:hypothetical protein
VDVDRRLAEPAMQHEVVVPVDDHALLESLTPAS